MLGVIGDTVERFGENVSQFVRRCNMWCGDGTLEDFVPNVVIVLPCVVWSLMKCRATYNKDVNLVVTI